MNKKLFGPIEIGLVASSIVLALGGIAYAGLSGVVAIPGLHPLADTVTEASPSPLTPKPTITLASPLPSPSVLPSIEPSPSPSPIVIPSPSPSPVASPTVLLSPSPSPITSAPLRQDIADAQADQESKDDLAKIAVALAEYKKDKGKYIISATFSESKTYLTTSPLQALVPKYIAALPTDPRSPSHYYAYRSVDGKSYELTTELRVTSDPAGKYDAQGKYLYTLKSP